MSLGGGRCVGSDRHRMPPHGERALYNMEAASRDGLLQSA